MDDSGAQTVLTLQETRARRCTMNSVLDDALERLRHTISGWNLAEQRLDSRTSGPDTCSRFMRCDRSRRTLSDREVRGRIFALYAGGSALDLAGGNSAG